MAGEGLGTGPEGAAPDELVLRDFCENSAEGRVSAEVGPNIGFWCYCFEYRLEVVCLTKSCSGFGVVLLSVKKPPRRCGMTSAYWHHTRLQHDTRNSGVLL